MTRTGRVELADSLRDAGLRVTAPRVAVLSQVTGAKHLTADHAMCRSCGAIVDVDCVLGEPPCLVPDNASGFVIDEAEVTFWGLCLTCQATPESNEKESAR